MDFELQPRISQAREREESRWYKSIIGGRLRYHFFVPISPPPQSSNHRGKMFTKLAGVAGLLVSLAAGKRGLESSS